MTGTGSGPILASMPVAFRRIPNPEREVSAVQYQPRMTWNDWGLRIVLSVLWGGSFFFAKVTLEATA